MAKTDYPEFDPHSPEGRMKLITFLCVDKFDVAEDEVTPDKSLTDDFKADSLDAVEMIMSLEEGMESQGVEIKITDEEAEAIVTVQDVIDLLDKLTA